MSPLQLRFLPELRDYAKAPFILTLILMLGLLVARPFTPRRLLALAMGYRAIVGHRLWIQEQSSHQRAAFHRDGRVLRYQSGLTSSWPALALSVVMFVVCAWPIVHGL